MVYLFKSEQATISFPDQGRNQGTKGVEAPPLAKSKLRKTVRYQLLLIFYVFQWSKVIWPFYGFKKDYITVKLQSHI